MANTRRTPRKGRVGTDVWNRGFVQKVLDTHNSAYRVNFSIHGRTEEVYPELLGQQLNNWDWVCRDQDSGVEAAVEDKLLTRQFAEQTSSELKDLGRAISTKLQDKLEGLFLVWVGLPGPDLKVGGPMREKLIDSLSNLILEIAKEAAYGQTVSKSVQSDGPLSKVLPVGTWLDLCREDPSKLKPEYRQINYLDINFNWASSAATQTLAGDELGEFRNLITKANKQLGVAKQKGIPETLLVLVEIGFSGADADALESTVRILARAEYCNIDHIYLVGFSPAQRIGGTINPPSTGSALG